MSLKFYKCKSCGNVLGVLVDSGVVPTCCATPMTELIPNVEDASQEKHIPVVAHANNIVKVEVGELTHPMLPEHYIMFVIVETNLGFHQINFHPGEEPRCEFAIRSYEKVVAVYAYCNIHGLWKVDL